MAPEGTPEVQDATSLALQHWAATTGRGMRELVRPLAEALRTADYAPSIQTQGFTEIDRSSKVNATDLAGGTLDEATAADPPLLAAGGSSVTLPAALGSAPGDAGRGSLASNVTSSPTSFPGLDDTDNPFGMQPPDPQIAVGPNHLVEMTNAMGRIFNRDGSVAGTFKLRDFFQVPANMEDSDPRVIYDAASGRYFASYLAYGLSETRVYVAVSSTNNPTGYWCLNALRAFGALPIADQPSIGVSDDKFTVSVNLFMLGAIFAGEQTVVTEKSDWLSCAGQPKLHAFPLRRMPWGTTRVAQARSAGGDQFLAEYNWGATSQLCVDHMTGTPAAGTVARTTTCRPVNSQATPPPAEQAGGPNAIETNDNRAVDAVWQDGTLWVAANAECDFGPGRLRACLHLVEMDTGTMSVTQDIMAGDADQYWYFPAITLDDSGTLYAVFSVSGASRFASVAFTGRFVSDPLNSLQPAVTLKEGEAYYNPTDSQPPHRWGDYSGASVDPTAASTVWVVGEYAKKDGGLGWGTWIAEVQQPAGPTPSPSPTPMPTATATPPPGGWGGDVDCSGTVNALDALVLLRVIGGLDVNLPIGCAFHGDVNCDADVNAADALDVMRYVAGLEVTVPADCPPIGPGAATPTPTPTPTPEPTPTPPLTPTPKGSPAPSSTPEPMTLQHTEWHLDAGGYVIAAGEVVNGGDRPVGLVRVEADFYSAGGELLKTAAGYSCLTTVPGGGSSPFEILLFSPPPSIDHVTVAVTKFFDPPFVPAPVGLQGEVTGLSMDTIGLLHATGSVTNNSGTTYKMVKTCLAFYDQSGNVFRSKFSYTSPSVLGPGQTGTFDATIKPGGATIPSARVWPDAMPK